MVNSAEWGAVTSANDSGLSRVRLCGFPSRNICCYVHLCVVTISTRRPAEDGHANREFFFFFFFSSLFEGFSFHRGVVYLICYLEALGSFFPSFAQ